MKLFAGRKEESISVSETLTKPTSVLMGNRESGNSRRKVFRQTSQLQAGIVSARGKINLYRFLSSEIPVVQACIATWVRMSAAPGSFHLESPSSAIEQTALQRLEDLSSRLGSGGQKRSRSLITFLTELFHSMYRDGVFAGFLTVRKDGSAIEGFQPIDSASIVVDVSEGKNRLYLEDGDRLLSLDSPDFYHLTLNADSARPMGASVLQTIPFVAHIQQQLVDDMRRTSHNAGYHRLHVKVTPPERVSGESDKAYIERINSYFDSTVSMIKSCRIDENPVTWDNVAIDHIGPENVRAVTNSWFMNHRAMIEEICAGTNLAPFMLGYSYGATSTWSSFKFDLVMRQVRSVQAEVSSFLEWIGNIELALAGIPAVCRFVFDNTYTYQAGDASGIKTREVDNLLRMFEAGLIDESTAREKARQLIS